MPVYLPVPQAPARGPDGQGWNRMSVGSAAGDECARRPTTRAAYWESLDTRRARYGFFGPCIRKGRCTGCPILDRRVRLDAFTDRVLVRMLPSDPDHAYLMNRPEDGWASRAHRWTWERLAALEGWAVDDRDVYDEHGRGFWLRRYDTDTTPEGAS